MARKMTLVQACYEARAADKIRDVVDRTKHGMRAIEYRRRAAEMTAAVAAFGGPDFPEPVEKPSTS